MERMHELADEIRETFGDRGYRVEQAVQLDPAFHRTKNAQSAMVRGLVLSAIEHSSARLGLGIIPVAGGGCDIQYLVDGVDRRFRVLKASQSDDATDFQIICRSDSVTTITEDEPDALFPTERWVLAYTVDDGGMVQAILCAPVLGVNTDAIPLLILGRIILLGTGAGTDPGSFRPSDEDDLDFDLDGDADAGSAGSLGA